MQVIYAPTGTTSFSEALTSGFVFLSDVVQSSQYYNSGAMGMFLVIMSKDHLCFVTNNDWLFHMKRTGGINIDDSFDGKNYRTGLAVKVRVWK